MIVAVSTDDGENLTQEHFGDGKFFQIYHVNEGNLKLLKIIKNKTGEEDEHGDIEKARQISQILNEMDILLGFRFGPNIMRIKRKFLPVVSRNRNIETALRNLRKNIREIERELARDNKRAVILGENIKFVDVKDAEL